MMHNAQAARIALFGSVSVGLFLLTLPVHLRAAKPLPDQPASATLRCAAGVIDCPSAQLPDRIRGDGQPIAGVLNTNRELRLEHAPGVGRAMWFDFTDGPPRCAGCRRDFDTVYLNELLIQTNVVDGSGTEVSGGLLSIPVGGLSDARLKIDFGSINAVGQSVLWSIRFNPESYPGSDHVTIRRPFANTWKIEATNTDRALLVSSIFRKNGTEQLEGPFYMPFMMTVVSPL